MIERVAICIATYRRPHGLERLLLALDRLEFRDAAPRASQVIVVDNDPDRTAEAVCRRLVPRLRWPLRYEHEPRRGISQARNRLLAAALEQDAQVIAFLDDDEVPEPRWLDEALRGMRELGADAVAGPVVSRFESPAPPWVARGGFFEIRRHPTGTRLSYAGTGNLLLRSEAVRRMERRFDESLGLVGGEDTEFLLRFTGSGSSLVWVDEALVHEWQPPSRVCARWILQREFRRAHTWSHCERMVRPGLRTTCLRTLKGFSRIAEGLALLALSFRGRHAQIRALHTIAKGVGNLAGVAGLQYREYQVTHGR
jgi:succinoglycan biosynthesis protein ExoM